MKSSFIDEMVRFFPACGKDAEKNGFLNLQTEFPDPEGILQTAYARVKRSCSGPLALVVKYGKTQCFEAYAIETAPGRCTVTASDPEGIRRGLYELAGQLEYLDPRNLPSRLISRRPWLKTRIARCFFGPIKRPPFNRDELIDDLDYYPESYLDRLAFEAVNMLWISVSLKEYRPDAPERARRISKLTKVVAKCRRYGIRVCIFCNEPAPVPAQSAPSEDDGGPLFLGHRLFCVHDEKALKDLKNLIYGIFRDTPGLGGMINICYGEGPTTCLSCHGFPVPCVSKCGYTPREIMNKNLSAMADGMHEAAPDAMYFAWFYIPFPENFPDWGHDVTVHTPDGVIAQMNFESGLIKKQGGKYLSAGDYWFLSEDASGFFMQWAEKAHAQGHEISAKIQAGCSHEVATVPYIPAPSVLYRKFRSMKRLHVSHAMLGWYFGTTPGLMNLAAGRLAFTDFETEPEEVFLRDLANAQWGIDADPRITEMWEQLGAAYQNYPLVNAFQYYGPVADGVRWPLYPEYAEKKLHPTWIVNPDNPSGDNIIECLGGCTLDEVMQQMRLLSENWHEASRIIPALEKDYASKPDFLRELRLIRALDIQFTAAYRILAFYHLRRYLYKRKSLEILNKMRKIAEEEIQSRKELIALIRQDPRLGFHPEAEAAKYDESLVAKSIDSISEMLKRDLPVIAEKIQNGTFGIHRKDAYPIHAGESIQCGSFSWSISRKDGAVILDIRCKGRFARTDELFVGIDMRDIFFSYPGERNGVSSAPRNLPHRLRQRFLAGGLYHSRIPVSQPFPQWPETQYLPL